MRFDLFEKLSTAEAEELLADFRRNEAVHVVQLISHAEAAGLNCDYTIESVPNLLRWLAPQLEARPLPVDESLPEWMKTSEEYLKGNFEFDERSRNIIVCAAFYLGEAFVRTCESLCWATGDSETAECNMPVVEGFSSNSELPPLLVLENLFARVRTAPEKTGDFEQMVSHWQALMGETGGETGVNSSN